MTIEEILKGESKNLEFKETLPEDSRKYMKTIVAFANGGGGQLIVGIRDKDHAVIGLDQETIPRTIDRITNSIADSCEPLIIPDIFPQAIGDKTVIVIEISQGRQRPYYIKALGMDKGTYIRTAGSTRAADRSLIQEMYYEDENRSFDTVINRDIKVTDKDIKKLCADMKKEAQRNCLTDAQKKTVKTPNKNNLITWGILKEENNTVYPTYAYYYLRGMDPMLSQIQCAVFKGRTRGIFVDKREYGGNLWNQVEEAYQFVLRNIHLGAKLKGVYRQDIYELPPDSIRELIINAVVNCSFLQGSRIQVAIYDDRLEISSPGGLMPGVTIDKMKEGFSKVRNHGIANAFSYMNLIEQWGSGIPKILRELKKQGLPELEFIDMGIAFRVNMYRDPENNRVIADTGENISDNNGESAINSDKSNKSAINSDKLSITDNEKAILKYIMENKSATTVNISAIIGLKAPRTRQILGEMVKKGLIIAEGANRNRRYLIGKEEN